MINGSSDDMQAGGAVEPYADRLAELYADVRSVSSKCADVPDLWDAIIVGAGPAGALTAAKLAAGGAKVLLVDKADFPRQKVCGSCLSAGALNSLQSAGLTDVIDELGAVDLHHLQIYAAHHKFKIPLGRSKALSRKTLDSLLVQYATRCGATFLPDTAAAIFESFSELVTVGLKSRTSDRKVQAKIAIAADGIGGTSLHGRRDLESRIAPRSKVGVGTTLDWELPLEPGVIHMAYGSGGYVGAVTLENGGTDIAAAMDPQFIRESGAAEAAVIRILREARLDVPTEITGVHWQGTVPLTRTRKKIASRRLFVIGDSASYVEPFTGEGIAWALNCAEVITPIALEAIQKWRPSMPSRWVKAYASMVSKKQRGTKIIAALLRSNRLAAAAGEVLTRLPLLIDPIAHALRDTGITSLEDAW